MRRVIDTRRGGWRAAFAAALLGGCVQADGEPATMRHAAATAPATERAVVDRAEIDSPLGSYLAGRLAHRDRDGEAAADYFARALEDDPGNFELLRQTFIAAQGDGRMAKAVALARRMADLKPGDSLATTLLVVDAIKQGDYAAASTRLEGAPLHGYNVLLVPMLKAWAAVGEGRFDAAHAALEPLASREAFAVFHELHSALIYDLAGDDAAAERAYRKAVELQPGGSYRTVAAFGAFYERSGRAEAALALYDDFQAANPDSVWFEPAIARIAAGERPERPVPDARAGAAEALFGIATAQLQENAVDAALVYGRMAIYLRPDFDAGYMLVGEALETMDRPAEANAAYAKVAANSPLNWTVRLKMASNLAELDRVDQAVKALRGLAAERTDRADALIVLGDLLRAEERWHESVAAYDEAFERIGEPQPRHWRPLYARGIALERARRWQRAERDFLTALDLEPDQPFVLNYLGYSWVDQGVHLNRALTMIERAVDLRPNDGYIIDSLGWAHYRLGNYADAVIHLERASELRPEDPTINDHLGDAYWRVGRRYEARFQWRRALSLEPEEEEMVSAIKEKLEHGLLPSPVADGSG